MKRSLPWIAAASLCLGALGAVAQPIRTDRYSDLRWRNIGPFRGGWSTCAEGIPDEPEVFYMGAAGGGIWKTDDAGETWSPLFLNEKAATVDAIAIAPSNPKIIYTGTGQVETRYDIGSGNGVYRSDDGGATWRHLGLADTRAIGRILVDSKNPDVVLVAGFGHIFGPNAERGVFRSENGGKTWTKTLFVDENTGVVDLAADPENSSTIYAAAWQARNYPWLSYFQPNIGPGSGIYKSQDGGATWKRLSGGGFPNSGKIGRIGLATASGGRVYAAVDARSVGGNTSLRSQGATQTGLYRSDDGGATWEWINHESWIGSDYFGRLTADPRNRDTVYMTGQSIRRSTDGGKTFEVFKGAPGGDDYHFVWINPKHPGYMVTASDQGTVVTVNGGRTWSSWYNQPTGQFYHLGADDRFPYWIYSGQQDSGTAGVASRSDFGALSYREWHPVGGDERDYDIPDPGDPDTVYASGLGGNLVRFDQRTGQTAAIDPSVESTYARRATEVKYRYTWFTPIAVSTRKPYAVYEGSQYLFRSDDRGHSWKTISPDLSGAVPGTKGCDGAITLANAGPCGFGVIFSIALSPRSDDEIWIGTDDGKIQVTRDSGKSWSEVSPKGIAPWSKIASLDISPLDPSTVYAAVDTHRLDEFAPRAYRTRDGGKTWTSIVKGFPADAFVDTLRADPVQRGLLYAATNSGVYVSFDDGDLWQPLQLNLPTVWVGDLLVHGNDLVAATQGRAIWILDDVSPLRELAAGRANDPVHLFHPAETDRVRRNVNHDTPLPPETPLGQNPPAGAIIDYELRSAAAGPVTLEILDPSGAVLRKFSSDDKPKPPSGEQRYFAAGWLKPEPELSAAAGHHRFVWDMELARPSAIASEYSIAAVWGDDTPLEPEGALVPPGRYTVRLTVGGRSFSEPLVIRMDPRVHATAEDLARQFEVARDAAKLMELSKAAIVDAAEIQKRSPSETAASLVRGTHSFARVNTMATAVFRAVESGDMAPTVQAIAELEGAQADFDRLVIVLKGLSH